MILVALEATCFGGLVRVAAIKVALPATCDARDENVGSLSTINSFQMTACTRNRAMRVMVELAMRQPARGYIGFGDFW